jgi:hypothetical protein
LLYAPRTLAKVSVKLAVSLIIPPDEPSATTPVYLSGSNCVVFKDSVSFIGNVELSVTPVAAWSTDKLRFDTVHAMIAREFRKPYPVKSLIVSLKLGQGGTRQAELPV